MKLKGLFSGKGKHGKYILIGAIIFAVLIYLKYAGSFRKPAGPVPVAIAPPGLPDSSFMQLPKSSNVNEVVRFSGRGYSYMDYPTTDNFPYKYRMTVA